MMNDYILFTIIGLLLAGIAYKILRKKKKSKSTPIKSGIHGFTGDYKRNVEYTVNKIVKNPKYGPIWRKHVRLLEYKRIPDKKPLDSLGRTYPGTGRTELFQTTYDTPKREGQHISNFIGQTLCDELGHHIYPGEGHSPRQQNFVQQMRTTMGFNL